MASTSKTFSSIVREKDSEKFVEDEPKSKKREEWKKEKQLEEDRKAGTVAPAIDEDGKDINPHIPQYISAAPWYLGTEGPTLKHQRPQEDTLSEFNRLNDHFVRGLQGPRATKFRKGACENCGAMGHKKKDCVERPRKVGAKYSNTVIASDDVNLPELSLNFDGKRDRWNGYDPSQYIEVVAEHNKIEECKRTLKATKLKEEDEVEEELAESDDEDKYAENIDMPGTKVDSKQRITVRNLRIREDTAKYLRNLDINSAHYDPKTRSMRDNPYHETNKGADQVDFAGDNFVRFSGDTASQAEAQMFAWEASEKGVDVSLLAEPTKVEMLQKQYKIKKDYFKESIAGDLLEKYGGKEHLKVPPKELLLAQTENYVEYSRQGKIIKGAEKERITSKYSEDIFPTNHSSVWGSYWREHRWGYRCCHSFVKNSYCTGEAGKSSNADWMDTAATYEPVREESPVKTLLELHKEKVQKNKEEDKADSKADNGLNEQELHAKDVRAALIKQKQEDEAGDKMLKEGERKRKFNSMNFNEKTLTEAEIEAHKIRRVHPEDPMANFK